MAQNKIGVGIIGAGKAGKNFAHALQATGDAEILGICAAHESSARAAAEAFHIPFWSDDYRTLLDNSRIQAVIVASPDAYHGEQTVAAAGAGKHILCEKPMCRSLEEADAMIEAARTNGVILMVGFIERFSHPCADAKRRIEEGEVGVPRMISARRCHPRSVVRNRTWLNDNETGGVLSYAGTHNIDLTCWFMDSAPMRVYAEMGQLILKDQHFTDCAVVTMQFPGNSMAVLYETFAYPENYPQSVDRSFEIMGDRGVILIDFMNQPLRFFSREKWEVADSVTWPSVYGKPGGALLTEVEHFLRCVREGREPLAGGAEGRLALEIAIAARRAADSGKAISVRSP